MAEPDHDEVAKYDNLFDAPKNARIVVEKHTVYVEPETKFYRFCVALAKIFSLASLIAWFVLLILLIILVFSMVNNLEALNVMRDQQAFFELHYSNGVTK